MNMNNHIDPQEAHSPVADKYINLISLTNIVLQTKVSVVEVKRKMGVGGGLQPSSVSG